MIQRFGIDTTILVRLLTGDPPDLYDRCVARLTDIVAHGEVFASNQVIGEAYVAVQHHYGVGKLDARVGLVEVLRSGLVSPLQGQLALQALETKGGCGLLDRLIALDYHQAGLEILTLDEKMARLPRTGLVV